MEGREAIAQGHQFIFDHFYKDTTYELTVRKIRFVGDEVAIVHLNGSIVEESDSLPEESDTVPMAVVQKIGGAWKVVAFHNAPFAVRQYGENGDIRRFKTRKKDARN